MWHCQCYATFSDTLGIGARTDPISLQLTQRNSITDCSQFVKLPAVRYMARLVQYSCMCSCDILRYGVIKESCKRYLWFSWCCVENQCAHTTFVVFRFKSINIVYEYRPLLNCAEFLPFKICKIPNCCQFEIWSNCTRFQKKVFEESHKWY